ncbi:MAG: LamG domain-containing protein, partial [Solirubrobacterales bacterium]
FDGDVKDSSGKGRNGTANGGPTYVAGVDGQAINMDGKDDYVTVGSVGISGAAPRTISGWVKADTTTITDWTNLFGFTSSPDGVSAKSFDMNKIGGTTQYGIHVYGWERTIMNIDLEWHHLAATYDGTTIAWYGDGVLVSSEVWALDTQDNVQMGKRAHAAGGNFPGSIDEVRIYNKALSAEEIAWLAGRVLPIHKPL